MLRELEYSAYTHFARLREILIKMVIFFITNVRFSGHVDMHINA